MKYSKRCALAGVLLAALAASGTSFAAAPSSVEVDSTMLVRVADGCGQSGWRGPGGHCHYTRRYVPGPVYYAPAPVLMPITGNGCPPGYWHGPWGHCRNTPYHGRLPNGGYK